ncbi:replication protein A 32 kDa subunit B isoform X2 [Rhodamnia argentea]|uniref:Replication protein A 32 kDa subunit B isoform X2 n=1 Tax=Rhodamnia argentea TaxID=178133 RepID=A0ABM3HCM3_9MYRT|nr:replication protein A 32 kDa subunit B isoform X2 [Rhodamnia argentea]
MAMFGSQFDGAAAFSGGGFMPSQSTTQFADPSSVSPAKSRDTQSLLPVTVKQINNALVSHDEKINVLIDGVDVTNVTLLGIVYNKAERVTDVTFSLDDGTGRIDCNRWINEPLDTNEMEGILYTGVFYRASLSVRLLTLLLCFLFGSQFHIACTFCCKIILDGMYVRVHGHLKSFQGKRQLNAFSIRPVTDYNEIASHFIECVYVHVYNTRLQKPQVGASVQPQMTNPIMSNSMKPHPAPPPNQHTLDGFSQNVQLVMDCFNRPENLRSDRGVHVNDIAQQLGLPVDKIREAIRYLEEEGLVYSTVNDNHYKSTTNA